MKAIQKITQWLSTNYQVKLLSLISALFLWFYVVTDNTYESVVDVPLRIKNLPEGHILVKPLPEIVRVLFRGTGKSFLGLGFRNKRIELDLSRDERTTVYPLTLDMVRGIPGSENCQPIQIIEPDSVWIYLDQILEKKIPVLSRIVVNLSDGYTQVGPILIEPDSVQLSGPETLVQNISSVTTKRRVFDNASHKLRGKIDLTPSEFDPIIYSDEAVRYMVDIQRMHEIEMKDIPVHVVNVPPTLNVIIVPSTLSLKLRGGVDLLMQMRKEDIRVTIDFESRYRYPDDRIPASINVPRDVSFSDVRPKFFECIVERK